MNTARDRIAAAFPDHNNNPALAILVPGKTAITPMCFDIRWLHVAAIHLSLFAFPADNTAFHFLCHGFAKLVREDECRLVGMARSAGLDGREISAF
jgi:hypothetical protein